MRPPPPRLTLCALAGLALALILVLAPSQTPRNQPARALPAPPAPVVVPSGTPQPAPAPAFSLTLGPNDRVQTLTLEELTYLEEWFPEHQWTVGRAIWCESRFDDTAVGAAGERGRLQILPAWLLDPDVQDALEVFFSSMGVGDGAERTVLRHLALVDAGLRVQGRVPIRYTAASYLGDPRVNAIVGRVVMAKGGGLTYWSTRNGCKEWNR